MTSPQLEALRRGTAAWNRWRQDNPEVRLDLSELDLRVLRLRSADLAGADLRESDLRGIDLSSADLAGADLSGADLGWMWFDSRDIRVLEREMYIPDGFFYEWDFEGEERNQAADLRDANLVGARLFGAHLVGADLRGANLENAKLALADLRDVNLAGANLVGADLSVSDLTGAELRGVRLHGATFIDTALGDNDLSDAEGLDGVRHLGSSRIGVDTALRSHGAHVVTFLRHAGIPEALLEQFASLADRTSRFASCFLSYSVKDVDFAKQLRADLQEAGVRCWFAPEDLRIGERVRVAIDQWIHRHDKLLLVLSQSSVVSRWVEKEVETAFERERERGEEVLFPITLDDAVMKIGTGWAADIRRSRNIGDFRRWREPREYEAALRRLLRDLHLPRG